MKVSETSDPAEIAEAGLPLRQWIMLATIGLFTVLMLAVGTELTARMLYPVSMVGFEKCFASDDLSGDAPVRPNGVCVERVAESGIPVEYRFNSRGNRAGIELKPKQPGVYRIVMIGSSMAMGLFVPQQMSFAALLPAELSQRTGRNVELYNEATGGKFRGGPFPTRSSALRFKEALSADPDMVLWVITPTDVENAALEMPPRLSEAARSNLERPPGPTNAWERLRDARTRLESKLRDRWDQTRTSIVLKHFLLENESEDQYVNSYLENEDDSGFLTTKLGARWQHAFEILRNHAEDFARQANSAHVSFVAVLIPNRAQAAMISRGKWPHGYDPYNLGNMLRTAIESYGGTYIDILPELRPIPNPEQHYFPVDGHLDADGHAMVSKLLVEKLVNSELLGLGPAASQSQSQSQAGLARAR